MVNGVGLWPAPTAGRLMLGSMGQWHVNLGESESKLWTTQFRLLSFLPVIVDVFESISPLRDIKNHPKYDQDIKKRNEI